MKKLSVFTLIAFLCAALCFSFSYINKPFDYSDYFDDLTSIYSEYDLEVDASNKSEFAYRRLIVSDYNGKKYGAVASAIDKNDGIAVLQYKTEAEAKNALKEMELDGISAEPDGKGSLCSEKGEMCPTASQKLGTPQFLSKYAMDYEDVIVAIIDTGVMYDHTDLSGRFYSNGYDLSEDECNDAYCNTNESDRYYYHATFVSGVIADNTPDSVKILPYKVVPFGTSDFNTSALVSAIYSAVNEGVSVINVSLTTPYGSGSIQKAIETANQNGVCVCVSAGNYSEEITNRYPAATPGAITVSALNAKDVIASFSSFGEAVDFCAPGSSIVSTAPINSASGYKTGSGTSFSSPYIAALCADIKSMNKAISKDDLYNLLCDFSVDYGEEGRDIYYGNGCPNLSDMKYQSADYLYKLPEGTLEIYAPTDYTAETQPWRCFAEKLKSVSISAEMSSIGSYEFYNVKNAVFTLPENLYSVGEYAFYGCNNLPFVTFDKNVESIGKCAFGGIDEYAITGYGNTPAEKYALSEGIAFNSLGCKHSYYIYDIVDPDDTHSGYTIYCCSGCNSRYLGAYIAPIPLLSGKCGDGMTFTVYDTGRLELSGSGCMYDYCGENAPWSSYNSSIYELRITKGVEELSQFAFYNMTNLKRFKCVSNNSFSTDGNSLMNYDGTELLLAPSLNEYTIPETVTTLSAMAFAAVDDMIVSGNEHISVSNGVLYDTSGKILAALPTFSEESLNAENDIEPYAFILTEYPKRLSTSESNITFGEYSVGYSYNGDIVKNDLVITAYKGSTAVDYAHSCGFNLDGYNIGTCGENIEWTFEENKLTFIGSGKMFSYKSEASIPWRQYINKTIEIEIDEGITSLSDYAFSGASGVNSIVMPLSMRAPHNETVWRGCSSVSSITLTYGTGVMDDYSGRNNTLYYTYTPWYLSRKSITDFSIDKNVKYIGKHAFRNASYLTELNLSKCTAIGDYAFFTCSKLRNVTLTNKNITLGEYCLFAYKISSYYRIYKDPVLHGYSDSTSRDYSALTGCNFESLGCAHSRGFTAVDVQESSCCSAYGTFACNDCGAAQIKDGVPLGGGHKINAVVKTALGAVIEDAELIIDGRNYGTVPEGVTCGNHILKVQINGVNYGYYSINVNQADLNGTVNIYFGDYNNDGVVNAKDYAYATERGYNNTQILDYGKVNRAKFYINLK